ncbi:ABC transporter ATP-binding protein [Paracoccus sp. PAR01]|uniref:ABC transporter ATP-binding protein n=1 Tax=Paracoccus sp. PAR01 TaxID=2769282 RepID=UPI00178088EB|nr:ABC transporter ATP-binding protein [Paracoccus sp. PAR01]MBD9527473.1 ABC transporter ATP-binding protein [Paracoccus sp. PAR01]
MIEVAGLNVSFGRRPRVNHVVRGVDLTIAEGECFGLVGESGCGKSTILGAIAGRVKDWQGTISIAGVPVRPDRRELAQLRQQQIVFQDPFGSLHPRHTIGRILAEPLEIHGMDDRDGRIDRALDQVGLPRRFRFRYPHQLSGGQRQRVAIARALILDPQILLLDEPTSALDVSIQAEILNLLKDLREERRLTYLLVSHDMAVVTHLCDRIAVMQKGQFVEVATREAMVRGDLTHPYTRLLREGSLGYRPAASVAAE